jgi:glycosyltransferase involved in cell wall biosynthesis
LEQTLLEVVALRAITEADPLRIEEPMAEASSSASNTSRRDAHETATGVDVPEHAPAAKGESPRVVSSLLRVSAQPGLAVVADGACAPEAHQPTRPKIRVSLPWNTANYGQLNAFHPLYGFLLQPPGDDPVEFLTLDRMLWGDLLTKHENNEVLRAFLADDRERHGGCETLEEREFWSFFDPDEAMLDEISGAELKFVHTTPVQCGNRCFVYHLESFETAFLPWTVRSRLLLDTPPEKVQRIRKFLLDVFESPRCLAIVSHVRKTLESFERFFGSETINRKLVYCPIGFPAVPGSPRADRTNARFLFTASLHGNSDNLLARGIVPVLKLIRAWQAIHPEDEFVFLSQVPVELLDEVVEDKKLLDVLRLPNVLSFEGQFLSDAEFARLLTSCDFVLLPSYQLHSATILRSMGAGVIPVVTNLHEVLDYGISDANAVVIDVFDDGPCIDSEVFGRVYPLRAFFDRSSRIAQQMFDKLLPLREDAALRGRVAAAGVEHVRVNFSPAAAAAQLREIVARAWMNAAPEAREDRRRPTQWQGNARFGPLTEFAPKLRAIRPADFDSRPIYSPLVDLGNYLILSNGREAVAAVKKKLTVKSYSLLDPSEHLLAPDKFSLLPFLTSWWEATNVAFEALVGAHPGPASSQPGPLKSAIFRFLVQHPGVRATLKLIGVEKLARLVGALPPRAAST